MQTYAIRCDGCGALFQKPEMRRAMEIRAVAARDGWRHALMKVDHGIAPSYDFCAKCTIPGALVEQPRLVLLGLEEARYLSGLLGALILRREVSHRDLAMAALGQLDRGVE